MIEIRPIFFHEADEFLSVLCAAFELDFDRARPLFSSEPFFDLARKWAVFDDGRIVSLLTTTPLLFGWGRAIGIAGVATVPDRRGQGLATQLMSEVLRSAEAAGEGPALLFAVDTRVYDSLGFEAIDRVIRAEVKPHAGGPFVEFGTESVISAYDAWASQHQDRLRRDEQRWTYWKWNFRIAEQFQDGYLCFENDVLREAVFSGAPSSLPVPPKTEFFGLTVVADQLELPLDNIRVEMYLMGRNVPGVPQFFLTDQF